MDFLAEMDLLVAMSIWDKITGPWAMNVLFTVTAGIFVVWIAIKKVFTRKKKK